MENSMICECLNCKPFQKQKPCCEFKKGLWKTRLRPGVMVEICCDCLEAERNPKKCGCYHPLTMAIHNKGICSCSCHKTKGVVEDKIMELAAKHGAISGGWEHELRDLVRMARETK